MNPLSSVAETGERFLESTIPGTSINVATGLAYGIVAVIAYAVLRPKFRAALQSN